MFKNLVACEVAFVDANKDSGHSADQIVDDAEGSCHKSAEELEQNFVEVYAAGGNDTDQASKKAHAKSQTEIKDIREKLLIRLSKEMNK